MSTSGRLPKRGRRRREKIEAIKNIQTSPGGCRVVRWCWVNFQCRGVLLIWIRVGQGPTVLAVGAGGGCLDIFSLVYHFSFCSPSLWETARYRLKYCLKGPLSPKQPTKHPPPAPTESTIGPCPTIIQISRTPRNWKFTQHLRTTRPPLRQWENHHHRSS